MKKENSITGADFDSKVKENGIRRVTYDKLIDIIHGYYDDSCYVFGIPREVIEDSNDMLFAGFFEYERFRIPVILLYPTELYKYHDETNHTNVNGVDEIIIDPSLYNPDFFYRFEHVMYDNVFNNGYRYRHIEISGLCYDSMYKHIIEILCLYHAYHVILGTEEDPVGADNFAISCIGSGNYLEALNSYTNFVYKLTNLGDLKDCMDDPFDIGSGKNCHLSLSYFRTMYIRGSNKSAYTSAAFKFRELKKYLMIVGEDK